MKWVRGHADGPWPRRSWLVHRSGSLTVSTGSTQGDRAVMWGALPAEAEHNGVAPLVEPVVAAAREGEGRLGSRRDAACPFSLSRAGIAAPPSPAKNARTACWRPSGPPTSRCSCSRAPRSCIFSIHGPNYGRWPTLMSLSARPGSNGQPALPAGAGPVRGCLCLPLYRPPSPSPGRDGQSCRFHSRARDPRRCRVARSGGDAHPRDPARRAAAILTRRGSGRLRPRTYGYAAPPDAARLRASASHPPDPSLRSMALSDDLRP